VVMVAVMMVVGVVLVLVVVLVVVPAAPRSNARPVVAAGVVDPAAPLQESRGSGLCPGGRVTKE